MNPRRENGYLIIALIFWIIVTAARVAEADEKKLVIDAEPPGPEVYALIEYDHTSDVTRKGNEPVQEYIGAGITIALGEQRRFEIDLTHGAKLHTGTLRAAEPGGWQSGTKVRVRFYPGGRR